MELSTIGTRRGSQPPSSLHHHHHPHKHQQQLQQQHKLAELPTAKSIGRSSGKCPPSPPFVHKKQQCRYPEDPDHIESIHDDEPIKLKHLSKTIGSKSHGKWTKKAQMNQYEMGNLKSPTATTPATGLCSTTPSGGEGKGTTKTLPHSYFMHCTGTMSGDNNAEYSYAYCEPIVTKLNKSPEHENPPSPGLPTSISSNALSKGPSAHLLRALLTKSFRRGGSSTMSAAANTDKHTFRTQYGTKENIYEDVGDMGARPKLSLSRSSESINKVPVTDELQFVQKQHDRIMGQLNLSIEALLMPSKDETDEIERKREQEEAEEQQLRFYRTYNHRHLHSDACYVGSSATMTPNYPCPAEFDSGISGSSSSGASYTGSMRYRYPITCPPQHGVTSIVNDAPSTSSRSSSSQLVNRPPSDPTVLFHSNTSSCKLSCCLYGEDQPGMVIGTRLNDSTNTPIESISEKVNFWNKIGKIYTPGSPKQQSPVNGKFIHKTFRFEFELN